MIKPIFEKVLQIAIVVKSVDETVRTYADKYGIGPWSIFEFNPETVKNMIVDDKKMEHKMRIAGTYLGDIEIELIEPLDDKSIYAKFLKEHGEGLHHIAYQVKDYEKIMKFFKQKGITINQGGDWYGKHIYTYLKSEPDLKHIAEIYKTKPSFFKFAVNEYENKRISYPNPLEVYPPEY